MIPAGWWGMDITIWCSQHRHRLEATLAFPDLDTWWAMFAWLKAHGMVTTWREAAYR